MKVIEYDSNHTGTNEKLKLTLAKLYIFLKYIDFLQNSNRELCFEFLGKLDKRKIKFLKNFGICYNTLQDSPLEKEELFKTWKNFTGLVGYPILSDKSLLDRYELFDACEREYWSDKPMYKGDLLKLRKSLVRHCIKEIEKIILVHEIEFSLSEYFNKEDIKGIKRLKPKIQFKNDRSITNI